MIARLENILIGFDKGKFGSTLLNLHKTLALAKYDSYSDSVRLPIAKARETLKLTLDGEAPDRDSALASARDEVERALLRLKSEKTEK